MRKIFDELIAFIKQYPYLFWVTVFVFLAITVSVNYVFGLKEYMRTISGGSYFFVISSVYAFHLVGGYLLYSLFTKDFSFWKNPKFVLLLILAIVIFAFRESFDGYYQWIKIWSGDELISVNQRTWKYPFRMLFLLIPVFLYWLIFEKDKTNFYGFSFSNTPFKVYFLLLLCMVPLIVFASTQTDFLSFYPRAKRISGVDLPMWRYILFELCYASDFFGIELFFRGFLVFAFVKIVGIHSIIPMACFYLSIHFGKPMGETISSFFGGTILGLISYRTKSINGGILIHVGIAWMMELGGFIGNYYLQ